MSLVWVSQGCSFGLFDRCDVPWIGSNFEAAIHLLGLIIEINLIASAWGVAVSVAELYPSTFTDLHFS